MIILEVMRNKKKKKCLFHTFYFSFLCCLMTAEAIKTLLTVPTDVFTNFTAVTEGLAGAVISAGWKVLAVVVIVWGSKGVIRWASGLFKKSVR